MRAANVLVLLAMALSLASVAHATDVVDTDNSTVIGQLNGAVTEITAIGYACIDSNSSINVTNASFTAEAIAVYSTGNESYIVFDDEPYVNTSDVTNITSYCTNFTAAGNYSTALILAAPVVTTGTTTGSPPTESSSSPVLSTGAIVGIVFGSVGAIVVIGAVIYFGQRSGASASPANGGYQDVSTSPRPRRRKY